MADYQYDSSLTVCLIAWRVELLVKVWWLAISKDETNHFRAVPVPWLEPNLARDLPKPTRKKKVCEFRHAAG